MITGIFFTIWWILFLSGINPNGNYDSIAKIENFKYLIGELLMAMFFWVAFIGRAYCYYCPLGTVLGFISKVVDQKIKTNVTNCIDCNKCNKACPMSIDIASKAKKGEPSRNTLCVGCGHCVDECPTGTLKYTTAIMDRIK